jgi:hypothetical protein
MPKQYNPGVKPLSFRIPFNGKSYYTRLAAGNNYEVVPDKDWPKHALPVDRKARKMTESIYRFITSRERIGSRLGAVIEKQAEAAPEEPPKEAAEGPVKKVAKKKVAKADPTNE